MVERRLTQSWYEIFVAMGGNRKELEEEMEFVLKMRESPRFERIPQELIDKLVDLDRTFLTDYIGGIDFCKGYGVDLDDY